MRAETSATCVSSRAPRNITPVSRPPVLLQPQAMERPSPLRLMAVGAAMPAIMSVGAAFASAGAATLTLLGAARGGVDVAYESAVLLQEGEVVHAATHAVQQGAEIALGVAGGMLISGAYATLWAALCVTAPVTWLPGALGGLATSRAMDVAYEEAAARRRVGA